MKAKEPNLNNHIENALTFHDKLASSWSKKYKSGVFWQRLMIWARILDLHVINGQTWMDAGCGSGDLTKVLIDRGAKIIAIDGSKKMVDICKADPKLRGKDVEIFHCDLKNLSSLQKQNINGIICSSVIEYFINPKEILENLSRVLAADGILILSVPNKSFNIRTIQTVLRSFASMIGLEIFKYLRFSRFSVTKPKFAKMLQEVGFELTDAYPFKPHNQKTLFKLLAPSMYIYVAIKK